MQYFTTLAASALALASMTIAAPTGTCPPPKTSGDNTYKVSNLYLRKPDGKNLSTIGFDISATNGGTLNFTCTPYNPATDATTTTYQEGAVYFCGKNSLFSFSYDNANSELFLWQGSSAENVIAGRTMTPNYCRAGGAGINDLVCNGVADAYITLAKV